MEKLKGQIIKAVGGFFYVEVGDEIYTCQGRGNLKKKGDRPLVGDFVYIEVINNKREGLVEKILPRKNSFIRPALANVDVFVVVVSLRSPQIQKSILDRFLVMAESVGAEVIIVISKSDLATSDEVESIKGIYRGIYPVVEINKNLKEPLKEILNLINGRNAALAGPSGVGKTTLINRLIPQVNQETGRVSDKTGRGKHTTRHTEIFKAVDGSRIFDTPGFSSFEIIKIKEDELDNYFPEIANYKENCKFRNCKHIAEPYCAVKDALEMGEISKERYESYKSQLEDILKEGKN